MLKEEMHRAAGMLLKQFMRLKMFNKIETNHQLKIKALI
jgi:hypothetical protein